MKDKISLETGAKPNSDELSTATFLAIKYNKSIRFLKDSNIEGIKTPDIEWCGLRWEIKHPESGNHKTIQNLLRKALKQSDNIIFDLAKIRASMEEKCVHELEKQFNLTKKMQRLKVIKKSREVVDFRK
jgi:hypothetical protein